MAKRINKAQINSVYWPHWRAAEEVLIRAGFSKAEAEEKRKDIHTAVVGVPCSSKDLTDRTLDAVLAKFAAISAPADGKRQADLADGDCKRIRHCISEIQARMHLSAAYVETMAVNIARTAYPLCDALQLRQILQALSIHEKRQSRDS